MSTDAATAGFLAAFPAVHASRLEWADLLLRWAWVPLAPLMLWIYLSLPPSPDQSIFDYIGWLSMRGVPYYSGAFEVNWPGAMMLHQAGTALFGVHPWTWRLTDFLLMMASSLLIALFLWRAGFRRAPFVFLLLYPALYVSSGWWMAGQRDAIVGHLLLAACALLLARGRRQAAELVLAGSLMALAILIRPTFLAFPAGVILLELLLPAQRPGRRIALMLAGLSAPLLLVLLAGWLQGNLADWYEQAVLFSLPSYQLPLPRWRLLPILSDHFLRSWHWMMLLATPGLLLWAVQSVRDRALLLVLGLTANILLSYLVQNKGFGYHFAGLLPVVVLFIAVLLDIGHQRYRASENATARGAIGVMLLAAIGLTLLGTAKKLQSMPAVAATIGGAGAAVDPSRTADYLSSTEALAVARLIQQRSAPQDFILPMGSHSRIGFLSERRPSSRFATGPAFLLMDARFPRTAAWEREFSRDLQRHPPRFIIIGERELMGTAHHCTSCEMSKIGEITRTLAQRRYRQIAAIREVRLFERTD